MFIFSKIFGALSAPANLLLFLLLAGTALMLLGRRCGRMLVTVVAVLMLAVSVIPVGPALVSVLEDRFPQPPLPGRVHGVVVLSGFMDPLLTQQRGQPAIGGGIERLLEFMRLGRLYPDARLIFSGGSGAVLTPELREADNARALMTEMGFDVSRVEFERDSRNTWENAAMSLKLAAPRPGETWLLVTSAAHMPRAVGCFRKAGFSVLPWPVDFATPGLDRLGPGFGLSAGLGGLNSAAHEWLGLLSYWMLGRTDALLPGPD